MANAQVRANAAALLVDAFPLQDPDANVEETDSLMQKQFDILEVRNPTYHNCFIVIIADM